MELKELVESVTELFDVSNPNELGNALLNACTDTDKLEAFLALIDGDLTKDWLQMIYQYYLADRQGKKQDYTPRSLATLTSALVGESDKVIDLCAGSGALIIQRWNLKKDISVITVEIDGNVIPFLLFNLVIRNIEATVYQNNAISGDDPEHEWRIMRGERFGKLIDI